MKEIHITLPMPPSVNMMYAGIGRRHKSKKYKQWIADANAMFLESKKLFEIKGDEWLEIKLTYFLSIYTLKNKKRILDTDNRIKATQDWLGDHIEGFKDHKVKRIIAEKIDSPRNEVNIVISEMIGIIK